ncbi:MAG: hypothetical protein WBA97_30510 [Actinophytocola sp.]|uniref:hypothetical protein n=1 Tax=Actinophytocola sp. TaxID=1872138 RepID=UPI003C7795F1
MSTAVTAEWTFRSAYVDEETPTPVAAHALRFGPKLDDANTAKANTLLVVPLSFQRNGSGALDRPASLTVDASFDEGKNWRGVRTLPRWYPTRRTRPRCHCAPPRPTGQATP